MKANLIKMLKKINKIFQKKKVVCLNISQQKLYKI